MKCCGQNRDSAFCPDCGKQLEACGGNLRALVKYCRVHEESCKSCLEEAKKELRSMSKEEPRYDRYERSIQNRERKNYSMVNRWRELIGGSSDPY